MRKRHSALLSVLLTTVIGCTTTPDQQSMPAVPSVTEADRLHEKAQSLATENERLEGEIARLIAERDALKAGATASPVALPNTPSDMFPPDPRPGHCYVKVAIPAQYEPVTERVKTPESGTERIEIIPAKYSRGPQRVIVKEASKRLELVPAVYETVTERVMIRPAKKKIVEVPATYKTVTEKVLDKAAHTVWKPGPASAQSSRVLKTLDAGDTGEIMCLVEMPASYKTVTRKVVATPATTRVAETPAEYATVQKRVLKTPATTREVIIPAEYKTIDVTREIEPVQERRITVPDEYVTVADSKKISDERVEWRSVLCEANMTKDNVATLQTALKRAGHYKGLIDGIMGPGTLRASGRYATARDLPFGSNYVTLEVIDSLGLQM